MTTDREQLVLRCGSCGVDRAFAPVECGDDHGEDCAELGCVDCGLAAVIPGAWAGEWAVRAA